MTINMEKTETEDRIRDWEKVGLKVDTSPDAPAQQICTCPECSASRRNHRHQKCVTVNVKKGLWKCMHCNASGYVPSLKEIKERSEKEKRMERMRDMPPEQRKYTRPEWEASFLIGNVALGYQKDSEGDDSAEQNPKPALDDRQRAMLDYLTEKRGLSIEVMNRARITLPWTERKEIDPSLGKDSEGKPKKVKRMHCTVAFNYWDRGVLVNRKIRFMDKQFMLHKGAELIPYNIDAILRKEVCYITEGEFDTLALMQAGLPESVSVPAGGANTNLTWLDRFVETHFMDKKTIYLALDADPVGLSMTRELIRRLGSSKCRVVLWDEGCKDANEELLKHGAEGILRCVKKAVQVPLYGIQTAHTREVERGLDHLFQYGLGHGSSVGIPGLDPQVSFETGRFMVVTGRPGDGKSEFVDELALRLCLLHEWRVAYFSPENVPLKYHLAKLVSKLTGYEFRQGGRMTPSLYAACKDWLDLNICHIMPGAEVDGMVSMDDGKHSEAEIGLSVDEVQQALRPDVGDPEAFTLDEVLGVAREAVQRRGVRVCVFDPLNSIRRGPEQAGMSDLQWYLHVCNTMLGFAHRNDVLVILVAHPRKVDRDMLAGRKRRVEMNDISGSSDFANKCDFCLSVDRDDDLQVVTVYVDKVKFKHLGSRGQTYLHYDVLTGRYVPCTLQRLSDPDAAYLRSRSLRNGEQLITVNGQTYLKTVDWRYFNIRWIDESGTSQLGKVMKQYDQAQAHDGQMPIFV